MAPIQLIENRPWIGDHPVHTSLFTPSEIAQMLAGKRPRLRNLTTGGPVRAYCMV